MEHESWLISEARIKFGLSSWKGSEEVSTLRFDPDGGDLGRGAKVSVLELAMIAPHVANILQALHDENRFSLLVNEPRPCKYGFEVFHSDKKYLNLALDDIQLPQNVFWYECDGHKVFELRGVSGGVTTALACYLITGVKK